MLFYKVGLHGGAAALTEKVGNIRALLAWEPAGHYAIEALTGQSRWFGSRTSRRWGCAIKHEDGRVEFLRAEADECPAANLVTIPLTRG